MAITKQDDQGSCPSPQCPPSAREERVEADAPVTSGRRVYRTWAGSPEGTPEDVTRCVVSVPDGGRSCLFHQCSNKRGKGPHGLYCGVHARWDSQRLAYWTPKDR